jgi:hypothetical protein
VEADGKQTEVTPGLGRRVVREREYGTHDTYLVMDLSRVMIAISFTGLTVPGDLFS